MGEPERLRVATYNIHKCQGFDRKISPARIVRVVHELDADVLCLQEVVHSPGVARRFDQAEAIAAALPGFAWSFGFTRPLHGGSYGNMTLTRLPLQQSRSHDVTHRRREARGVLQSDLDLGRGRTLHVFNVHLGTGFMERRGQAKRLLSEDVLGQPELRGSRLVLGDFNEWTRGLTTQLLQGSFQSFRPEHAGKFPRTFPGMLPLVTLDHCYYEPPLVLETTELWRSRTALVASDHLPLVATFRVEDAAEMASEAARDLGEGPAG